MQTHDFGVAGLQHIGLPVHDLEASIAFYSQIGFQIAYRRGTAEGLDFRVAFLELGGLVLELYELAGDEMAQIKARTDGHWDHVALDVPDIGRAYEAARSAGWTVLEGETRFLPFFENGVRFFTVRGPSGEKVEFNQRL